LVSINQLGLGIWGWTLTGLLIGYEINTRSKDKSADQDLSKVSGLTAKASLEKINPDWDVVLFSLFGLIVGGLIAMSPLRNSIEVRSLSGETTIGAVEEFGMRDSLNPEISILMAGNLTDSGFDENALRVIRNTVKNYPDNYFAWKLLSLIPSATPQEIALAQMQMKRLDPLNPELK
jgi:hypothetical protein